MRSFSLHLSFGFKFNIEMPRKPIKIVLPDGKEKEGTSFVTTPMDIAKQLSNSLPEKVVVAKVKFISKVGTLDDGLVDPTVDKAQEDKWELYDATRPLEGDCELQLLKFDDPEGKLVFWHSSAHILGESMEREFGVHLCHGPPTESGFFYDAYTGSDVILIIMIAYRFSIRITTRLLKKQPRR